MDGEKIVEKTHSTWPESFSDFVLGTGYLGESIRDFNGSLDEFRVWNEARSEAEILANKGKELTGNEDGLLVYYDFNQNASSDNLSYTWLFNGPASLSSTDANPTVTFSAPGTYSVVLNVNDGTNDYREIKGDYIIVQSCEPEWPVTETGDNHTLIVKS